MAVVWRWCGGGVTSSLFLQVSRCYILNSVVIPAVVGAVTSLGVQHTPVNQAWYEPTGVVNVAATLIVVNTLAYNGLRLAQALPLIQRTIFSHFTATQEKLRNLYAPPVMRLGNLYAETTATIGLGLIYGPMYPPAYALVGVALVLGWITTKFAISFWYRKPPAVNTEMLDALRFRLSVVLGVAIVFQGLTAWYAAGSRQLRLTLASTVLSPLLWFFYEVAPFKQLRCLKPVDQFVSSMEAEHEASLAAPLGRATNLLSSVRNALSSKQPTAPNAPDANLTVTLPAETNVLNAGTAAASSAGSSAGSPAGVTAAAKTVKTAAAAAGESLLSNLLSGVATIGLGATMAPEDLSNLHFDKVPPACQTPPKRLPNACQAAAVAILSRCSRPWATRSSTTRARSSRHSQRQSSRRSSVPTSPGLTRPRPTCCLCRRKASTGPRPRARHARRPRRTPHLMRGSSTRG